MCSRVKLWKKVYRWRNGAFIAMCIHHGFTSDVAAVVMVFFETVACVCVKCSTNLHMHWIDCRSITLASDTAAARTTWHRMWVERKQSQLSTKLSEYFRRSSSVMFYTSLFIFLILFSTLSLHT